MKNLKRNIILLFSIAFSLFFLPIAISQQAETRVTIEEEITKDTLKVGTFITTIYDLSLQEQSFNVEFWMWFTYKNDKVKPLEAVEITNAKEFNFVLPDVEQKGDVIWATHKCRAVVKQQWRLDQFPFDTQYLTIKIEDAVKDTSELIYIADSANSNYDKKNIVLDGWDITNFKITGSDKVYQTSFGDPDLGPGEQSVYSNVNATITIVRRGVGVFFKLFSGAYVAFLMGIVIFLTSSSDMGTRTSLLTGAIFATVGNKYIADSVLPQTTTFTLVDRIHSITFAFIVLGMLFTFAIYYISAIMQKKKLANILDYSFFILLLASYIILNIYYIYLAIHPINPIT